MINIISFSLSLFQLIDTVIIYNDIIYVYSREKLIFSVPQTREITTIPRRDPIVYFKILKNQPIKLKVDFLIQHCTNIFKYSIH